MPGFKPAKRLSGRGVTRSFPREREYARNSAVTWAHTTWVPWSCALVLQQPSRKKPVTGSKEHATSAVPNTFSVVIDLESSQMQSLGLRPRCGAVLSNPRSVLGLKLHGPSIVLSQHAGLVWKWPRGLKYAITSEGLWQSGAQSCATQYGMLCAPSSSPRSPYLKRGGFHVPAHRGDDGGFIQSKLGINRLESRAIFPSHIHHARDVSNAQYRPIIKAEIPRIIHRMKPKPGACLFVKLGQSKWYRIRNSFAAAHAHVRKHSGVHHHFSCCCDLRSVKPS